MLMAFSLKSQEAIKMVTYVKNGDAIEIPTSDIDSITFYEYTEGVVINGTRWATRNVDMPGTFAATPKDAGMFYQWNKRVGWSSTDPLVNSDGGTTWDRTEPWGNTWEKANDPCPAGWRLPTNSELQSLINAGSRWTMFGRVFGAGNNTIFLPAAGFRYNVDGMLLYLSFFGSYWSNNAGNATTPNYLTFGDHDYYYAPFLQLSYRTYGYSVRCVADPSSREMMKAMIIHLKNGNTIEKSVSDIDSIAFYRYDVIPDDGVIINGIRWATRNVDKPGTFAENQEDAGMFYQWNRETGWSNTDPMINSDGGTTWDSSDPTGTVWEEANDPCPTGWRVPTSEEYYSLIDAGHRWTTVNDVPGRLFGTGNNTIFLPAAGNRNGANGALENQTIASYWSSVATDPTDLAVYLLFSEASAITARWYRSTGMSVRCVAE